ncbi:MAG: hypothetical protein ACK5ZG_01940 [Phycisphaerae bacterium]|jgi:hypothetical protein
MQRQHLAAILGLAFASVSPNVFAQTSTAPAQPAAQPEMQMVEERPATVLLLRREAGLLRSTLKTPDAHRFVIQTNYLPVIDEVTVYVRNEPRSYLTPAQYEALPEDQRADYVETKYDDYFFYYTRYGSPLAYVRAIDLIAQQWGSSQGGPETFRDKKIVDFGFGGLGQLRMMGNMGAHVTGIEVDPLLQALYADPALQGEVTRPSIMDDVPPVGSLKLVFGQWPADDATKQAVAERGKFDLFISKNTLKRGYITPEKEVDPRMLVQLGVSNDQFVKELADAMNPGGLVMIYNICPKQAPEGEPYKPWADGRCPFTREQLEAAGFEVIKFDEDDTPAAREMGRKLEWDNGASAMDLESDLVVSYTLLRKKSGEVTQ